MTAKKRTIERTPEEALVTCIEAMKGAARLPVAPGVEDWLNKEAAPNFEKNFAEWPTWRDQVIASSRSIGQIATILANLTNSATIGKEVLKSAVKAVRPHCTAKHQTLKFCPNWV